MKRRRTILLLVLYLLVFAFTIAMEYFSIMNPGRRLLVNGSTFLMALVSGVLFWLIYRGDRQREDAEETAVERKKVVEGNKRVEGNKGAEGDKVVEGNKVVEGGKRKAVGAATAAEAEIDEEYGAEKEADGLDEAGVHESEVVKVDGIELAELEAVEVSEAGSEESKVDGVEVAESDTDEVQRSGVQPQMEEHIPTVVKKSEKTQEDVLFDKGKYLSFANSHQLTRREAEIGLLVMNGYSNMQIAETLFIAETTVKKHLSHIYEKAGISGRKEFRQSVNAWNNTGGD